MTDTTSLFDKLHNITPPVVTRYIDCILRENTELITCILQNQNVGRLKEAVMYLERLQANLTQLGVLHDIQACCHGTFHDRCVKRDISNQEEEFPNTPNIKAEAKRIVRSDSDPTTGEYVGNLPEGISMTDDVQHSILRKTMMMMLAIQRIAPIKPSRYAMTEEEIEQEKNGIQHPSEHSSILMRRSIVTPSSTSSASSQQLSNENDQQQKQLSNENQQQQQSSSKTQNRQSSNEEQSKNPGRGYTSVYSAYTSIDSSLPLHSALLVQDQPPSTTLYTTPSSSLSTTYTRSAPSERKKSRAFRYWTPEEHALFMEGVQRYGTRAYKAISKHVGTRSPEQVKRHMATFLQKAENGATHFLSRHTKHSDRLKVLGITEDELEAQLASHALQSEINFDGNQSATSAYETSNQRNVSTELATMHHDNDEKRMQRNYDDTNRHEVSSSSVVGHQRKQTKSDDISHQTGSLLYNDESIDNVPPAMNRTNSSSAVHGPNTSDRLQMLLAQQKALQEEINRLSNST